MKAKTVPPIKLIAAYGLDEKKLASLSLFCDRENIKLRPVYAGEEVLTAGELCRPAGQVQSSAPGQAGECLIFAGFDRAGLSQTVDALRQKDIRVALKAALTPSNAGWTLGALLQELAREHEYMSARGGAK